MELALALAVMDIMERAPVFEGRTGVPWLPRAVNRGLFSGRLSFGYQARGIRARAMKLP